MHVHEHVRSHRDFQHQNILKKLSQTKGFDVYARKLIAYKDILWNKYQSKNIYKIGHTLFYQIVDSFQIFKKQKKKKQI